MDILGLENDFYLSGNDIWIKVFNTISPSRYLDVSFTNETTNETISGLRPYPNLLGEYKFCVTMPVRALLQEPNHLSNNSLNRISIRIVATLENGLTEQVTLSKYFLRGGKNKRSTDEWYLTAGTELIVGKWASFTGITLPTGAQRLQGTAIADFTPSNSTQVIFPNNCNATIVRFLNSLGGYQYWVFEQAEEFDDVKAMKTKSNPTYRLREDPTKQLGTTQTRRLTLKSSMPIDFYDVGVDLMNSIDILRYDPTGNDDASRWERLILSGSNKLEKNTISRRAEFEVEFELQNYVTREL